MKALFRSLLLWCLLAGVPFQGFASAAMLLCGPQPAVPAMQAMAQGDHRAGHHEAYRGQDQRGQDQRGRDHLDRAAPVASQDHEACHQQPAPADPDHHAGHACAHAAACCTGAALAMALPAAPTLPGGRSATIPFIATAPAAVHLAGPERPPRPTPA